VLGEGKGGRGGKEGGGEGRRGGGRGGRRKWHHSTFLIFYPLPCGTGYSLPHIHALLLFSNTGQFICVLGIEPRVLCTLGKHSLDELHPQPLKFFILKQGLIMLASNLGSCYLSLLRITGMYHHTQLRRKFYLWGWQKMVREFYHFILSTLFVQ
jgi:hypothetical protein